MSSKEFEARTTINAPADKVWSILIDTEAYPEWDPYCDRIEGQLALGNKIKAFSKLSPGRAFPVKVTQMTENQKMIWQGGMPLGLFKGVRTFSLEPNTQGEEFRRHEVFSGPMLPLIAKSLPDMSGRFEEFVQGLKARAEA